MSPQKPSAGVCLPAMEDTIVETIEEVPSYDVLADRKPDAHGYVGETVACRGCEHQFAVISATPAPWRNSRITRRM
jgi:hypothetical protein